MKLNLPKNILNILEEHQITDIKKLKDLSRGNLKDFGLSNDEINKIIVQLQLAGYDLKKKYKRID